MPTFDPTLTTINKYPGHDPTLRYCVIVDLDGTIANHSQRHWAAYDECHGDAPIWDVIDALQNEDYCGTKLIFMSGREDSCYDMTRKWIAKYVYGDEDKFDAVVLYMRATKDYRPDFVVKNELFEKHIAGKYNVARCYDDRDQVVALWRYKGLTCFQVAEGNF